MASTDAMKDEFDPAMAGRNFVPRIGAFLPLRQAPENTPCHAPSAH
jgi:hypothetical protein